MALAHYFPDCFHSPVFLLGVLACIAAMAACSTEPVLTLGRALLIGDTLDFRFTLALFYQMQLAILFASIGRQ